MPVWGQSGAPTLVIRIDDLGALHSVNEACIQTYRSGIARSVEVMPVAAWYPEAIKMLKENPDKEIPKEKWEWASDLVQIILFYEVYKRRHNNHNGILKF